MFTRCGSKRDVAIRNEVLAKVVCHNVVCCIHAAHELRIDVGFGGVKRDEPDSGDAPWLIRLPGA